MKNFNYYRYLKVCEYFVSNEDNRDKIIAKHFGISINDVKYYIDVYLSLKSNYMGKKIELPSSLLPVKNEKIKYKKKGNYNVFVNGIIKSEINKIIDIEKYLDIFLLARHRTDLRENNKVSFYSYKLKKHITIEKIK